MAARFSDPFDALFNLQKALDARLTSGWLRGLTSGAGAFPPVNIFQQGEDLVAIVELAGIDKKDLEIQAKGNRVRISGRKAIKYDGEASLHRRERVSGVFDRTLSLPIAVDADRIKAEYRDGILALYMPRLESDKPRSISIN